MVHQVRNALLFLTLRTLYLFPSYLVSRNKLVQVKSLEERSVEQQPVYPVPPVPQITTNRAQSAYISRSNE